MIIVWNGWGIVSLLLLIGATLPGFVWPGPYTAIGGPFVAAVANLLLGYRLNLPFRAVRSPSMRRHSLFLIPMEWWSLPMAAFGCYLLALNFDFI